MVENIYENNIMIGSIKQWVKSLLCALGLYGAARRLWNGRPDFRLMCWNAGYRVAGAPDGLPIPPTRLIYLVTLSREVSWFLRSGYIGHRSILHILQRNGVDVESFDSILDFGCGCGRIIRYWKVLRGPRLYGTDYNPDLIAWCRANLGDFAEFKTNELAPGLEYEEGKFGFVYAISVFTHLSEALQIAWMKELARVLKRGGFLLITTHGESRLYELEAQERQRFQRGELVIKQESAAGTNFCGAYHPEQYVREHLAKGFEVVDFVPRGARDTDQDVFLLRKPSDNF